MQVRKVEVGSFRIFEEKSIELTPGLNFISGENARGKTTLLEAIYLLMAGRSFRTEQMNHLIREGSDFFRLETSFEKWGIPQSLKMSLKGSEKRIQYNSSPLTALSGLLGIIQGVLIAPHDIELIKGPPPVRRHYLDFQIAQVDPLYIHHVMRYSKALKQRNMQIRFRKTQAIEIFEASMALSATYIIQQREAAIKELSSCLDSYYKKISGKPQLASLRYQSSFGSPDYDKILEKLKVTRLKDLDLGYTSLGIHRDDLSLNLEGRAARHFASEGETRSLVTALKLAEWERMRTLSGEDPLLLVDDIGISLDSSRLNNLFEVFSGIDQIIITSAIDLPLINETNYNIIKL